MSLAYKEACRAEQENEVPVGAVIVQNNQVIAQACNQREKDQQVTSHAELLALQKASLWNQSWNLKGCCIYVTLEPCSMCMGGILSARLDQLIFATKDPQKKEAERLIYESQIQTLSGIMEKPCSDILTSFLDEYVP